MKRLLIFLLSLLTVASVLAQGRKDYRDAGYRTKVTYKYVYKTGKEIKILDARILYDERGNAVEVFEYDDYGKITRHEKNEFNESNDKITETDFDASGKVKRVLKKDYDANKKKICETEYDGNGKLMKTIKFTYQGEFITERLVYDEAGKLVQKRTYSYSK